MHSLLITTVVARKPNKQCCKYFAVATVQKTMCNGKRNIRKYSHNAVNHSDRRVIIIIVVVVVL